MRILFKSFSSLKGVARIPKTSNDEYGHPCLNDYFKGNIFKFFIIDNNVCSGFAIFGFHYVEICSIYDYFGRVFFFHKKL